ncbi:hypothetical protein ABT369_09010 [Dactylosporangium sp. NPDC000244]|uniref:SbtR family transcriptional regulator n=1 Tax=Dactylosporangium sp. NPDC000244 TaxID=3154365 RepID=UPI00331F157F
MLTTLAELTGGRHQPGTAPVGHGPDLAVPLHRAEHLHRARHQLHTLLTDVIRAAADGGAVRTEVPAAELAAFCLHALGAAADLPATRSARGRLVTVALAALQPG